MYSVIMEGLADVNYDLHEVGHFYSSDVHGRDYLGLGELPDVQLMDRFDAIDSENGLSYFFNRDAWGNALKEDK